MIPGFSYPWFLLLLLLVPAWAVWYRRQPERALAYSRTGAVSRLGQGNARVLARVPLALRVAGICVLIVALAGPRTGTSVVDTDADGIAIMLVLDLSTSMLAEDFHPRNRLAVAKAKAAEFIRGREHDRIGLVAFAGEALTQVPLTTDYQVLFRTLEETDIGLLEDGTAIGTAIATAANRLRRAPGESRVMILLTDGVNNRGDIDPLTAAQAAAAFDIKIYGIGIGSEGMARMPVARGLLGSYQYTNVPVEIDEDLLGQIAGMTGARYFRATNPAALDSVYVEIDRLETTTVETRRRMRFTPRHLPFILLAAFFLAGEWLLRASRWGRLP